MIDGDLNKLVVSMVVGDVLFGDVGAELDVCFGIADGLRDDDEILSRLFVDVDVQNNVSIVSVSVSGSADTNRPMKHFCKIWL